jgi:hypothetical protein
MNYRFTEWVVLLAAGCPACGDGMLVTQACAEERVYHNLRCRCPEDFCPQPPASPNPPKECHQ